jgi:hypothetical protein
MGVELPATRTVCTAQELVDALVAVWPSELGGTPSLECACILAAQWALETAEGHSMICWNIGNEKCPDVRAGDYCYFSTIEIVGGASVLLRPPDPGCRFRAFASLEDGVQHYLRGMWSHWTKAWPFACSGDPAGFAQGLHDQGYYTAAVSGYIAGVERFFGPYMKTLTVKSPPA